MTKKLITFRHFVEEEIANTTANVDGMRTEPLVRKRTQVAYVRRNAKPLKQNEEMDHV